LLLSFILHELPTLISEKRVTGGRTFNLRSKKAQGAVLAAAFLFFIQHVMYLSFVKVMIALLLPTIARCIVVIPVILVTNPLTIGPV
jgi:hypothetical protein